MNNNASKEMNPQIIMNKIELAKIALQRGNDNIKTLGVKKANAVREYRVALKKELLRLKMEKQPMSIIQDLAKGDDVISKLRLERDLTENSYTVCQEAMRNTRLELETLRSLLTWLRTELRNS
jgi:hypothetical protein